MPRSLRTQCLFYLKKWVVFNQLDKSSRIEIQKSGFVTLFGIVQIECVQIIRLSSNVVPWMEALAFLTVTKVHIFNQR